MDTHPEARRKTRQTHGSTAHSVTPGTQGEVLQCSIEVIDSLSKVSAAEWNALDIQGIPFLRYEFLLALEIERCAHALTGWQSRHLLLRARGELVGAVPVYLKLHSWGEFVFDWSWANVFAQQGLAYYPKLTSAVPFTPATGPRLLIKPGPDAPFIRQTLIQALKELVDELQVSSAHVLFATAEELSALASAGFLLRSDCQFHWHNRGYSSFDDFLATFRTDKRKKALRERRRVREAGICFEIREGDIDDESWDRAFAFSQATFARHGQPHYLTASFFKRVARALPEATVMIRALAEGELVGVAICFQSHEALYGRYWGQAAQHHSLHFETCYFQGIEYCIRKGLQRFEPGTQGEHKIARGFEPTLTHSAHWIADARLAHALATQVARERLAVERYRDAMREHLPFHRG